MSRLSTFGIRSHRLAPPTGAATEFLLIQRPLTRILAFTRRSIDDIVNDPHAKREVLGYFKLHKQINRAMETTELERQWNSVA